MAEGEGFEPPVRFPVQRFSRPPPSTTRPSLRPSTFYQLVAVSSCFLYDRRFQSLAHFVASQVLAAQRGRACKRWQFSNGTPAESRLSLSCPWCRSGLRRCSHLRDSVWCGRPRFLTFRNTGTAASCNARQKATTPRYGYIHAESPQATTGRRVLFGTLRVLIGQTSVRPAVPAIAAGDDRRTTFDRGARESGPILPTTRCARCPSRFRCRRTSAGRFSK